jgi:hypothetical protein
MVSQAHLTRRSWPLVTLRSRPLAYLERFDDLQGEVQTEWIQIGLMLQTAIRRLWTEGRVKHPAFVPALVPALRTASTSIISWNDSRYYSVMDKELPLAKCECWRTMQ